MVQEIEKEKAKQLKDLEERRRVAAESELEAIKAAVEIRIQSAQVDPLHTLATHSLHTLIRRQIHLQCVSKT